VQVNSPESGKILELFAAEGDTVSVGGNLFNVEVGEVPADYGKSPEKQTEQTPKEEIAPKEEVQPKEPKVQPKEPKVQPKEPKVQPKEPKVQPKVTPSVVEEFVTTAGSRTERAVFHMIKIG
jgi:2-oxoglutarate dehydrogenase E2 component (dihydrolipoamide succinyltransferase)